MYYLSFKENIYLQNINKLYLFNGKFKGKYLFNGPCRKLDQFFRKE